MNFRTKRFMLTCAGLLLAATSFLAPAAESPFRGLKLDTKALMGTIRYTNALGPLSCSTTQVIPGVDDNTAEGDGTSTMDVPEASMYSLGLHPRLFHMDDDVSSVNVTHGQNVDSGQADERIGSLAFLGGLITSTNAHIRTVAIGNELVNDSPVLAIALTVARSFSQISVNGVPVPDGVPSLPVTGTIHVPVLGVGCIQVGLLTRAVTVSGTLSVGRSLADIGFDNASLASQKGLANYDFVGSANDGLGGEYALKVAMNVVTAQAVCVDGAAACNASITITTEPDSIATGP